MDRRILVLPLVAAAGLTAGCGGSKRAASTAPTTTAASPQATTATKTTGASALQAEANSAAAGDIPDNQVFLTYRNRAAGYSLKYPEGWAQQGSGSNITFRDKNNFAACQRELGTCVDRWNQGNMISWGPVPANAILVGSTRRACERPKLPSPPSRPPAD